MASACPRSHSLIPGLSEIVIEDVPEGVKENYRLCLVTEEEGVLSSGLTTYTVPRVGMTEVSLGRTSAPYRLADPLRDVIYLSLTDRNEVRVLSTVTDRIVATIGVGLAPADLALSPDGAYLYVAHTQGPGIAVIDLATYTMERWVPIGREATAVAVHPITDLSAVVGE